MRREWAQRDVGGADAGHQPGRRLAESALDSVDEWRRIRRREQFGDQIFGLADVRKKGGAPETLTELLSRRYPNLITIGVVQRRVAIDGDNRDHQVLVAVALARADKCRYTVVERVGVEQAGELIEFVVPAVAGRQPDCHSGDERTENADQRNEARSGDSQGEAAVTDPQSKDYEGHRTHRPHED